MIQNVTRNKALLAISSIVIGVLLIIFQKHALDTIIRVLGWVLLVTGGLYVLAFLFGPAKDPIELGFAGMAGIAGLLMVLFAPSIVSFFPIMMGVILILSGLGTLMQASQGDAYPVYSKFFALLTVALGVLILIRPGQTADIILIIIGAGCVLSGLNDLLLTWRFWKTFSPSKGEGTVE